MGSFTAALLDALLSVGISPERARNVVELFDRSIDERYGLHAQVLATKRDVAEINALLGRDIAHAKVDLTRWVPGALTAQTALLLGAMKLL